MRRLESFRGESGLFTWVCQICRNEIVDHIRAERRMRHVVLIDDQPELRAAVESIEAPEEFDLVKSYGRAESARLVRVVLDRLPSSYGDALEWKYIEGRLRRDHRRTPRHRHDGRTVVAGAGAARFPGKPRERIRRRRGRRRLRPRDIGQEP